MEYEISTGTADYLRQIYKVRRQENCRLRAIGLVGDLIRWADRFAAEQPPEVHEYSIPDPEISLWQFEFDTDIEYQSRKVDEEFYSDFKALDLDLDPESIYQEKAREMSSSSLSELSSSPRESESELSRFPDKSPRPDQAFTILASLDKDRTSRREMVVPYLHSPAPEKPEPVLGLFLSSLEKSRFDSHSPQSRNLSDRLNISPQEVYVSSGLRNPEIHNDASSQRDVFERIVDYSKASEFLLDYPTPDQVYAFSFFEDGSRNQIDGVKIYATEYTRTQDYGENPSNLEDSDYPDPDSERGQNTFSNCDAGFASCVLRGNEESPEVDLLQTLEIQNFNLNRIVHTRCDDSGILSARSGQHTARSILDTLSATSEASETFTLPEERFELLDTNFEQDLCELRGRREISENSAVFQVSETDLRESHFDCAKDTAVVKEKLKSCLTKIHQPIYGYPGEIVSVVEEEFFGSEQVDKAGSIRRTQEAIEIPTLKGKAITKTHPLLGHCEPITDRKSRRNALRLLGEIAFQLDRRIFAHVFEGVDNILLNKKRRRYYGFAVSRIREVIESEKSDKSAARLIRCEETFETLKKLGYVEEFHTEFSVKLVNEWGLTDGWVKRVTSHRDPGVVRAAVLELLEESQMLKDVMILLNCLVLLAEKDGRPMFLY